MSNRVADETARQFVHEWQSPRPRDTGADSLTAYDVCADLIDARAECERLRGEIELADCERSSAAEAATVLLTALGWSSGGLGSAAIEMVERHERLRAKLAEAVEALRPFARAGADPAWKDYPDSYPMWIRASGESYATLEDLRRAARVVDGAK